ncbi:type II secretion system F family protein [Simiduia agarivorans]|uniref:Type IV pilus biogenesis protein PilC n=1 Tax=Simiduia agarivorans (strain DSM 21679 / JCM 13881 / BCRC 17597 / SA1) TaxID=1117647 RepID=K4KNH4_SIMAS|nr:type II secretion system F family protein [Simiduia agarivorans]AFV00705.1 type IV pilus biogenesis protein PilC [Simiduia agarivorans SA1 = DSM 21679]
MATAAKMKPQAKPTIFIYKGVDRKGKKISGEIDGSSAALVKAQLLKQGIKASTVRKKPKPLFGGGGKAIQPQDIAIFTRQMATMMRAGVPLVQSFEIVADGLENPNLRKLVLDIRENVASGNGFAKALEKHPKYFDELFCNLVESGEQSGALETMLDRIATYKEKTEKLKAKIKKAMTYPIAVLVVAVVVTGILLVKVVPQFAETFSSFGAELPAFTLLVLGLSEFAQEWWLMIVFGIVGSVFALKEAVKRSEKVAYQKDRLSLKLPIVGQILYNSIVARFARTLSTTFSAGVPLIDALTSVSGAAGNALYRDAILKVREEVSSGIQLNTSLRAANMFPPMLIQMTAIGEESGALDEMLDKVAEFYEDAVDNMVDNLTALLEPMIMAVLGILVGGLMVAMYLPIFQLGAVV